MFRNLTQKRRKQGFTLMEVMVVVGIIAVIAAIAIPSVITMQKNMDYKQRCDYAKTVFLAAQSNLVELRSTGELKQVDDDTGTYKAVLQSGDISGTAEGNLPERFAERYLHTYKSDTNTIFDIVLPVNAVESVIRDQNIIIEYNPRTGSVYAVFYSEDNIGLADDYQHGRLQRNEEWLKKNLVGYYNGSDLNSEELGFSEAVTRISPQNGQEMIINIDIPRQNTNGEDLDKKITTDEYVEGLELRITVIGETGGKFTYTVKEAGESASFTRINDDEAKPYLRIPIVLDSLIADYSFTCNSSNLNDSEFYVLPGDNVSLILETRFVPSNDNADLVLFDDAVLAGVNPLFHSLTGEEGNYTVAISNGRHLQNLNALDASIAGGVKTITFVNPDKESVEAPVIDWNETVNHYWEKYKKQEVTSFDPIINTNLFNRTVGKEIVVDGKNAHIIDLKIDGSGSNGYVGLFGILNGADVKDLRIINPAIHGGSGTKSAGTLAGSAENTTISNCYVYVDTDAKNYASAKLDMSDEYTGGSGKYGVSGYGSVGGMVGYAKDVTVSNCFAAVPVYGDMSNTGAVYIGVGGFVGATKDSEFKKSYTSVRTLALGAVSVGIDSSCGLGGFVGTSYNSGFANCFASANVTSFSAGDITRNACGGFVGVAIQKESSNNGLFNSCYSLGTVRAKDSTGNLQAKFVGTSFNDRGLTTDYQDFYKDLLNSNTFGYLYRDCYYLQGKTGVENADDYTLPASFDMLYSLYNLSYTEDYVTYVGTALKLPILTEDIAKSIGSSFEKTGFWTKSGNWMQGLASKKENGHYPYNEGYKNHDANYPYSMLTGMPFYGTWPDAPSKVGIAYWEAYPEGIGFYYDQMEEMTLQNGTVLGDGYLLFSANGGKKFEVVFNGDTAAATEGEVLLNSTITLDGNTYYYGYLPVTVSPAPNSFYTRVEIKDSTVSGTAKTYTMYFNPNVAASQISPAGTSTTAQNPGIYAPSRKIIIRSARQLAALGTDAMMPFWNGTYELYGNLDFSVYGVQDTTNSLYNKYFSEYGIGKQELATIGTTSNAFVGTLTGVSNTTITVDNAETGLINVMNGGEVSGITMSGTMTLDGAEGALVNTMNGGTLSDCAVDVKITANGDHKDQVGLVVGALNGGTISNTKSTGTNADLEFVGTAKESNPVAVNTKATHYSSDHLEDGSYTTDQITKLTAIAEGETFTKRSYAAVITGDCTYVRNGKTLNAVAYDPYYYAVTGDDAYKMASESAVAFLQVSNKTLADFGMTATDDWMRSNFYTVVNSRYMPVFVKIAVTETQVATAADTEDTTTTDPTTETTTPTEPQPTVVTTYEYQFSYQINGGYIPLAQNTVSTETPESYPFSSVSNYLGSSIDLYTIGLPTSGTYVLVNGTKALTAAGDFEMGDGITEAMIWTAGASKWTNGIDEIEVVLTVADTGSAQYPMVTVNGSEYQVYAVAMSSDRDVALVDKDPLYATTVTETENT